MDANKCSFIGRLARDPQFFPNQDPSKSKVLATLMVNNPNPDSAEAIPLCAWGKRAEALANHGHKGMELYVEGPLRSKFTEGKLYIEVEIKYMSFGQKKKPQATPNPPQEVLPMDPPQDYLDDYPFEEEFLEPPPEPKEETLAELITKAAEEELKKQLQANPKKFLGME